MKKVIGAGPTKACRGGRLGVVTLLLVAVLPLVMCGCFGTFPLTQKMYKFNQDISSSEAVQTLTLWTFAILPVYSTGMLVDAFIFNAVEFWTDEEILSAGPATDSNRHAASTTPGDSRRSVSMVSHGEKASARAVIMKLPNTEIDARDTRGSPHDAAL